MIDLCSMMATWASNTRPTPHGSCSASQRTKPGEISFGEKKFVNRKMNLFWNYFFFDVLQFQSNIFTANTRISFDFFVVNIRHFDSSSIRHDQTFITDSATAWFDFAHNNNAHFLQFFLVFLFKFNSKSTRTLYLSTIGIRSGPSMLRLNDGKLSKYSINVGPLQVHWSWQCLFFFSINSLVPRDDIVTWCFFEKRSAHATARHENRVFAWFKTGFFKKWN